MKEIIYELKEKNYINKNNELKIIKSISEIDPIMISIVAKKKRKLKIEKLERECRRLRIIINQIQIELKNAIENKNDREIDRLIEVRGYYMRDLKNTERELSSMM